MDLDECRRKGYIRKVGESQNLIDSMIEISDTDENTVKEADITQKNVSSYISVAYDSLREILEAVCLLNGYKVTNHICIGELLKSIDKAFEFEMFDRFRYIRNGVKYYGTKVGFEQGKEVINKMFKMKKELKKRYFGS